MNAYTIKYSLIKAREFGGVVGARFCREHLHSPRQVSVSSKSDRNKRRCDQGRVFYERLERVNECCLRHNIKFKIVHLNARLEKESIFGKTVGKAQPAWWNFSKQLELDQLRRVVCSTRFPRRKFVKLRGCRRTENYVIKSIMFWLTVDMSPVL